MRLKTLLCGAAAGVALMATSAAGAQSIELWTTETQSDRIATIQLLVDTFMALNPSVTVEVVAVDENDVPTQIAAAAAAGTLPNLINAGSELMVAFGEEGILDQAAATEMVDRVGRDRFFAGALNMHRNPETGEFYALPFHGWIQGIWYRGDWFDEAGLEPPNTWENIRAAAEYFHDPAENQYGILIGNMADSFAEQVFTQFAISNGGRQFDADGNLVFNSEEIREALEFYVDLAEYAPPGPQTWRARDYYIQGRMAMFFYSTFIMDDLALAEIAASSLTAENFAELAGGSFDPELVEHTRMVPIISNAQDAGYGVVVSMGIVDSDDQAETEAAQQLLSFLYEPDSYITWLHMAPGGMNPVLRDIAANDDYMADPRGIFARYGTDSIQEIIAGLEAIQTFSLVDGQLFPASGEIFARQIIPQMIFRATWEDVPVDEAVAWAEAQMLGVIGE